jgi:uncharacterized membrane protein
MDALKKHYIKAYIKTMFAFWLAVSWFAALVYMVYVFLNAVLSPR